MVPPARLDWYAPWWSYGPERFRDARVRRLWGLRVWLRWAALAWVAAGVGLLILYVTNAAVLAHVSWLRIALLPVAVMLIPLCLAAEFLAPPIVRVEAGTIRIDDVRVGQHNLVSARIEPHPDGRGLFLHVEYATRRGRMRTRRVGLKASIDPRLVKAVFERGSTKTLDMLDGCSVS